MTRWHAIEQVPAESAAYLSDGAFVSGDYIRKATIVEIDGAPANKNKNNLYQVELGNHKIKVLCSEARGEFDSAKLTGEENVLVFNAEIQRIYLVQCHPFTHWWIEDSENHAIVAGEKP